MKKLLGKFNAKFNIFSGKFWTRKQYEKFIEQTDTLGDVDEAAASYFGRYGHWPDEF